MASMTPPQNHEPGFPRHRFDFNDPVYVLSLQEGGTIQGIWYDSHHNTWWYTLTEFDQSDPVQWGSDDDLKPACPNCFAPWTESASVCGHCGFSIDS